MCSLSFFMVKEALGAPKPDRAPWLSAGGWKQARACTTPSDGGRNTENQVAIVLGCLYKFKSSDTHLKEA